MRVGLQTWGSEGDINPFIALATGLVKSGHSVKLYITEVSERDYSAIANQYGFELINVPNPMLPSVDMMAQMGEAFKAIRDPSAQLKIINTHFFYPAESAMFDAAKELCASSDLVVRHIFCYPTQLAAELAHVPVATLYPVHNIRPNSYQAPFGAVNLGRWAIPLWWRLAQWMINRVFLKQINHLRTNHHQKIIRDVLTEAWSNESLNLIAVSRAVCPPAMHWPENFKVCGFLNPSALYQASSLSSVITDFVSDLEAPVYFTFGSMLVPNEASWLKVYETWRETVRGLGCRAIFQLPIPESTCLPNEPNILVLRRAPHSLIFPFCSAVVHHGGAGTTQSSLLAGCPSIVVAHIADQPFWGSELKRLGVSPGYMRKNEMTSRLLGKFLSLIYKNPSYRDNAMRISKFMKNDNAIDTAIQALTDLSKKNH